MGSFDAEKLAGLAAEIRNEYGAYPRDLAEGSLVA